MTHEAFKEFELIDAKFEHLQVAAARLDTAHYAETEVKYKTQPLAPKYQNMVDLERHGLVAYFGAFHTPSSKLIGHVFYYLSSSNHSDGLVATEDRFYIVQEHRGSGLARRLLRFAENGLKARGVTDVYQSSKHPVGGPHIGPLLETEGYSEIAAVYHKAIV